MDSSFKNNAIWKHKEVVGLDIGTDSIKAVQLKKKRKTTKLVGYGRMAVPANYVIEGIISEPEKLSKNILEFFEKSTWGKINAPRINMSLAESKVFTKIMTLPHATGKSREDAVIWEGTQIVPMAMTDLYVDWQFIGPNKNNPTLDDILFTAAPKSIVNSYLQLVNFMGLEMFGIETSLTAITRSMIPNRKTDEISLVVDMGGETTNLAIFDQFIRVTGSTLVGGNNITRRISEILKIDLAEAEKMKIEPEKKDLPKVKEIIDKNLDEITREIERMIRYYAENNKDKGVNKVLLSGGSASLPGLAEDLTARLNIPTQIGNPWTNISIYPIKPVPKGESSLYANAIGLALVGVEDV